MNKAVFLDRDGVINRKGGSYYIFRKEDFIFNEGIPEALRKLRDKGYLLIVITNQGGISKSVHTEEDTQKLHEYMTSALGMEGITITAVYYCPHHPDNKTCECRKPGHLLFERAIAEHDIEREKSVMIGDSDVDIEAAARAGIRGIKITTNSNLLDHAGINSL